MWNATERGTQSHSLSGEHKGNERQKAESCSVFTWEVCQSCSARESISDRMRHTRKDFDTLLLPRATRDSVSFSAACKQANNSFTDGAHQGFTQDFKQQKTASIIYQNYHEIWNQGGKTSSAIPQEIRGKAERHQNGPINLGGSKFICKPPGAHQSPQMKISQTSQGQRSEKCPPAQTLISTDSSEQL